jgi:hypothetical protein
MTPHYFNDLGTYAKELETAKSFSITVHDEKTTTTSSLIPIDQLPEFCAMLDTLEIIENLYVWAKHDKTLTAIPVRQIRRIVIGLF